MRFLRIALVAMSLMLVACTNNVPRGLLRTSADTLAQRRTQSRIFETSDEKMLLSASAALLQDLGFNLDDSETELGLVVASNKIDATKPGQVMAATALVILSSLNRHGYDREDDFYGDVDDHERIRASIVTRPAAARSTILRVTFQRLIWNKRGELSRVETIDDQKSYQDFFAKLSKAVYLQAEGL